MLNYLEYGNMEIIYITISVSLSLSSSFFFIKGNKKSFLLSIMTWLKTR